MIVSMSTPGRLLALARPKGAFLIAGLPLAGFGYGLWERGSTVHPLVVLPAIAAVWLTWVLGHAGAMWLNAELDRDEGEVLFGRPVSVPRGAGVAGYLALCLSVAMSLTIGGVTSVCAAVCALLAVLYSHPRVALKGRALSGPLINGVGYGSLSPIAGWAAAEGVLTWRAGVSLALAVPFILGVYFAAQAFQATEDRRRGYHTLVATHGPRMTLWVARACLGFAALGAMSMAAVGAYPRITLVTLPIWVWVDRHLARWSREPEGGRGADAKKLVLIVTFAAFTMVTAAYVHHIDALIAGLPVGGCGTAVVPHSLDAVCARQVILGSSSP